jgi:hypothetical protein
MMRLLRNRLDAMLEYGLALGSRAGERTSGVKEEKKDDEYWHPNSSPIFIRECLVVDSYTIKYQKFRGAVDVSIALG